MSSNNPALIVLDEDAQTLNDIEEFASPHFTVITTRSAERALAMLQNQPLAAVLIVDQTLSNGGGLAVLKTAQTIHPKIRRVLIAGPGNLAETIEGLHSGAVERIIYKPIRAPELLAAIIRPHTAAPPATLRATA